MNTKKRNGIQVMLGLIGMVKPLLAVMAAAIIMGCIGNLMATFITVFGGYGLLHLFGVYKAMDLSTIFICIIVFAVLRGILRYAEQASNHYIAFKLLARIRHKVFQALRRLAPAKLDGSEKGNLISIITSDIELLEVFYAHTISPIAIAVITSFVMCIFIGHMHFILGVTAGIFYLIVGAVIPIINGKKGSKDGSRYRYRFGELNTVVLDNLYGLEEILQYSQQKERMDYMQKKTQDLETIAQKLKKSETVQRIATDEIILAAGVVMVILSGYLAGMGLLEPYEAVIAVIALFSSFGPTAALSALSNNLNHTLASGNRVLNLLEEEPIIEEVVQGEADCSGTIQCDEVSFGYGKELILDRFHAIFEENKIYGIFGKSGCGKSTLLKLLMRFYETQKGSVKYGDHNVNQIQTSALRKHIAYVTQETFLFHDTIANNIKIAKEDATREEIIEAAKKASIHEFILSLPNGYDTKLSEMGDSISGGEKQRIGIARAFLHNSKVILLDEPTSNIDSLNEGIILQSLEQERKNKTIILVSHRKSTMGIVDQRNIM